MHKRAQNREFALRCIAGAAIAPVADVVEKLLEVKSPMEEEFANVADKPSVRSFECESCGQSFESWPRLRQHQVDCQIDDFDNQA